MADQKVKVVHLITRLELGGAQGNTIYTVENLNPERYETHLWYGPKGYWDDEVAERIPSQRRRAFSRLVRAIHPLYDFLVVRDLIRAFRDLKPTIVHTHSSKAGIVGRIAAHLAGVPIIIHTFHGFGFNRQQKPWTRALFIHLEKWTARWSRALIYVSQANWEEAKSLGIGDENIYHRIRSGIPLKEFQKNQNANVRKDARAKYSLGSDPVLLTIGAFKPQKNLLEFLEVTAELKRQHPGLKALIVGDGTQRRLLEQKINEWGLKETVSLLGWRKDISELMAAADLFVMTSLWEGLPRALAEALASGLPAVCYDADGVRDLLSKGGGFLIPSRAKDLMVAKLNALINNKELRQKLAAEGPDLVKREFDIDEMVQEQDLLYQQLITKK